MHAIYIITTDHKMAILHGVGKYATLSCTAHSIQGTLEFFILNGNVIQEHAVLRSNKQMNLLPSYSYRKASNS